MAERSSSHPRRAHGRPVALGPLAAHRRVAHPAGLVHDEADQRPLRVEDADARGEEGHTPVRVGRAVDGVDHRQETVTVGARRAGFLREHGQTRPVQHGERGPVGGQVEPVLARAGAGRAPIVQVVQRVAHGSHGLVEHFEQPNVVHEDRTLPAVGPGPRPVGSPGCGSH